MGVRPPAFTLAAVRAMAPGGGDAAEEHRGDVADALGHQLHVGAVMAADHGVGHHAGEQRLDGGQNGDGDAVGELVAEELQGKLGHTEGGQGAVDDVEVADGADLKAESAHQRDARKQSHKRAGHALSHARPEEQYRQADNAHQTRLPVHRGEITHEGSQLLGRLHRNGVGRVGEAEEVLQLADGQRDGDTRREPSGDGEGDEADDGTQLEQTHENEQDARDNGGSNEALHAIGGHNAGHNGGEGRRGTRDLHATATEERDEEAGDDGGVEALFRRDAEAMPSAMESGSATTATTTPATMSLGICSFSSSLLECLIMLKRMGFNLSRCCMAGKLGSFDRRGRKDTRPHFIADQNTHQCRTRVRQKVALRRMKNGPAYGAGPVRALDALSCSAAARSATRCGRPGRGTGPRWRRGSSGRRRRSPPGR